MRLQPQALGHDAHEWMLVNVLRHQLPRLAALRVGHALKRSTVEDHRAANVLVVGASKGVLANGDSRCV